MAKLLALLISVATWATPEPQHSAGLLVIYGSDRLVAANADWHGYTLDGYAGGLASISPAHLGRIAWIRRAGLPWIGPLLVVDVTARHDFPGALARREIAEITYADAHTLGFDNGGQDGYVWWGVCPPADLPPAEPYAPPLVWDFAPYEHTPSWAPYAAQQRPVDCAARMEGGRVRWQ